MSTERAHRPWASFGSRTLALALAASLLAPRRAAAAPETPAAPAANAPSPPSARPEPSAGDLATARLALREGLTLREQGDLRGALGRLTTAYDLVPTPITAFELGKTHMLLGRVLQAHELFKKIGRMPPALEESPRSAVAREEAARLAADLEPRIPTLRLRVTLPPDATASVRVDDDPVTVTSSLTPRAVDPGKHVIVAKAGDGPEQRVTVDVAEGETKDVELAPQWIAPQPKPAAGSGGQVVYLRQTNPLVFVGFGASAVALTLTIVGGVLLVNAADRTKDRCGVDYCSQKVRDTDLTETGTWAVVTAVGGVATVAFAALGVISISRPINEKVVSGVTPFVGFGRAGLEGRF